MLAAPGPRRYPSVMMAWRVLDPGNDHGKRYSALKT
jgi:hypothetical protein